MLSLNLIVALRFLGLFLVLPLISLYAMNLEYSTTLLVGITVGCYALTQMIFQIPFGVLSDKIGRKETLLLGLILFIIGSLVCALASNIYWLILGRFLQGSGAIAAVAVAMISDLVQEEKRPKAMAKMGASVALSFAFSMVLGPTLGALWGVEVLFVLTALLALICIIILLQYVPDPPKISHTYNSTGNIKDTLKNSNLIKMNITNFLQKAFMTFSFMIIPIVLTQNFNWEVNELYKVYTPAILFGLIAMGPAAIMAEKKGKFKEILIVGIALFALSFGTMGWSSSSLLFVISVVIFFIGFNIHEPIMQSLATKYAKVYQRGFVLGVFNSFGYLGTFLGGVMGGFFFERVELSSITTILIVISVIWAILIYTMPNPTKTKNLYLKLANINPDSTSKLNEHKGIEEWYINETEQILIVKYDASIIEENIIMNTIIQRPS